MVEMTQLIVFPLQRILVFHFEHILSPIQNHLLSLPRSLAHLISLPRSTSSYPIHLSAAVALPYNTSTSVCYRPPWHPPNKYHPRSAFGHRGILSERVSADEPSHINAFGALMAQVSSRMAQVRARMALVRARMVQVRARMVQVGDLVCHLRREMPFYSL